MRHNLRTEIEIYRKEVALSIRQAIGGTPGTRLVWHVLAGGLLSVRVKNKTAADVKGIVKAPKGRILSVEEMRP